jgi:exopolysaccharide biosynthesis predicted pyruvyltransferase EpsI
MHPAFNSVNVKKYKIKNKVIWFEHKKQLIKDFGDDAIPRFVNSGNNIEHTIELLGSTEIILTNSYHGAYWGTLLRKKVIVVGGAWSTKFNWMKHPPMVLSRKQRWQDVVDEAPIYKDALEECRTATEKHWMTIKGML